MEENSNLVLDELDKKILGCLEDDGRMSLSRVGKRVGASRERIHYRFHRLVDEGVIKYFEPVVDYSLTGRVHYKISLNLVASPAIIKQDLANWVMQFPRIRRDVLVFGGQDVKVYLWAHVDELKDFFLKLRESFGASILEKDINVVSDTWDFGHAYLHGQTSDLQMHPTNRRKQLFEHVLRQLRDDGRKSSVDIAAAIDVSAQTVARRIKSMKKSGVLACVRPRIDVTQLGYTRFKVVVRLDPLATRGTLLEQLRQHPNVVWAEEVLGGQDLGFVAHFSSSRELETSLHQLQGAKDFLVHVLR